MVCLKGKSAKRYRPSLNPQVTRIFQDNRSKLCVLLCTNVTLQLTYFGNKCKVLAFGQVSRFNQNYQDSTLLLQSCKRYWRLLVHFTHFMKATNVTVRQGKKMGCQPMQFLGFTHQHYGIGVGYAAEEQL